MDEKRVEQAIEIVVNKIAELTNIYAETKDEKESNNLKEKIDLLKLFKEEVYLGNNSIIEKVINENKRGIL